MTGPVGSEPDEAVPLDTEDVTLFSAEGSFVSLMFFATIDSKYIR